MPIAYSVDNITTIISGIIANADQLRNISVRGVVSLVKGQGRFSLLNENKDQIECFIPKNANVYLPQEEKSIIVVGNLSLHPTNSIYQIKVINILEDDIGMNVHSVEDITNELTGIISGVPELQNIQIQGEVSALYMSSDVLNWELKSKNNVFPNVSIIQCVRVGTIDPIVQINNEICVQGKIAILPQSSKYQIEVFHIVDDAANSGVECQCLGCEACQTMQVKRMCPPLQNPDYELCQLCYHVSPDRNDRVKNTVFAYFYGLADGVITSQFKRGIHVGTDNTEGAVVMVDENGCIVAISECKGAGYIGSGLERLNQYLSTTDVSFGMFANRVDPSTWEFYKNLGQDQFEAITSDQFKEGINELTGHILTVSDDHVDTPKSEKEHLEETLRELKEQFDKIKEICQNVEQIAVHKKENDV